MMLAWIASQGPLAVHRLVAADIALLRSLPPVDLAAIGNAPARRSRHALC